MGHLNRYCDINISGGIRCHDPKDGVRKIRVLAPVHSNPLLYGRLCNKQYRPIDVRLTVNSSQS